jgi:hypothetical protein
MKERDDERKRLNKTRQEWAKKKNRRMRKERKNGRERTEKEKRMKIEFSLSLFNSMKNEG